MKKNLFLRLCLILAVTLSAYSCRTDHFPEAEKNISNSSKFQLTSKRVSLNESKHKSILVLELEKAKTAFKNSKSLVNGRLINYGNGVSIDTESVIYIENGPNFHTYTFNIKRENAPADAPLENLLLVPFANGTYKEFLVTYHLTPQEKENISNGYYFYSGADTTITELTAGTFNGNGQLARLSCGWTTETIWTPCSSGDHDGSNYQSCDFLTNPNGTPPSAYTISSYSCAEVKDSTIEEIPVPIGGGGSTGGGGAEPCTDCLPEPNIPEPCLQVPTDPTQPSSGMVDENGCAIALPTLPNVPVGEPRTDCERLYEKTNDAELKHKLDSLSTLVTQTNPDMHETAFVATKQGGVVKYKIFKGTENVTANNTKEVEMEITNVDIATGHNHNPNSIPIFAPQDLVVFYKHYKLLHDSRKNIFVMFNTNFNGTVYAFRMQDVTALDAFFAGLDLSTNAGMEKAEKKVKDIYRDKGKMNEELDYTADMAERMLMKVLNSSNLGANSVSLYQFEDNIWKKLSSKSNGSIHKIPCP